MSDEALKRATGRGWDAWGKILDKDGAKKMSHKEIATLLRDRHGVGAWWCQAVTVGYERSRGLRDVHEMADGFRASISRVIAAPLDEVYPFFEDAKLRRKWLPVAKLTVRKATKNKSVRITWPDGTNVEILFDPHGDGKSRVAIQHSKLPEKDDVATRKAFWSDALEKLKGKIA